MTNSVGFAGFARMWMSAVELIRERQEHLTRLDAKIGDGDHGVSMMRAAAQLEESIQGAEEEKIAEVLKTASWAFLGLDCGATGPLLGLLFMGMADEAKGREELDVDAWASMFEAGLTSLRKQTKAKPGDKTMMDALVPATEALRSAADEGLSLVEAFGRAATAAREGAEATKEMVARVGRAKHQGERTLGHPDPGATSMSYIFEGLRAGLE